MEERVKEIIKKSNRIVFFGGAGVSTESNIPDFRSETGLYHAKEVYGVPPETILSHTYFMNNTETFFKYYRENLVYTSAKPNRAHMALSKLEEMGKLKAIATQNIDGLHQMAGSKVVYELHGTIHKNHCMKCGEAYNLEYVLNEEGIPRCKKCGGIVKPDVVLYEESLDDRCIENTVNAIMNCDTLIIGGTSLNVYPAAGLIRYFRGDNLVLINKEETPYDSYANLVIHDKIGDVLDISNY